MSDVICFRWNIQYQINIRPCITVTDSFIDKTPTYFSKVQLTTHLEITDIQNKSILSVTYHSKNNTKYTDCLQKSKMRYNNISEEII